MSATAGPIGELARPDLGDQLVAVLARHGDVAHQDVRVRARERLERVAGRRGHREPGPSGLEHGGEQLFPRVPEDLLRLGVDEDDAALAVDADDRVGSGLEETPEQGLATVLTRQAGRRARRTRSQPCLLDRHVALHEGAGDYARRAAGVK